MKSLSTLIVCLTTLAGSPVFGQSTASQLAGATAHQLTKFNLDFPGGTPNELVAAIQKAMGRPLNAIVSTDLANRQLPPLKMSSVDVAQLFAALLKAAVPSPDPQFGAANVSGFIKGSDGQPTDDTVWVFFVGERPPMPKFCRFYLLTPYLERGLTVDDVTTAIQTAWKMQGDAGSPTMSYHKETKLLIAVGDGFRLETIDRALEALKAPTPKTKATTEVSPDSEMKKP